MSRYRQQLARTRAARLQGWPPAPPAARKVRPGEIIDAQPGEQLDVVAHIDDGTDTGTEMVVGRVTVTAAGRLHIGDDFAVRMTPAGGSR